MVNNKEINVANLLQIYYIITAITIYFMQMFFYCYAGELMIDHVSYMPYTLFIYKDEE